MTILLVCGILWANPNQHWVRRVCYEQAMIRHRRIAGDRRSPLVIA